MGFLDLVEQHHLIRTPPYRLGQGAALLITDIARWGADHAADRVLFHVFGHVEPHHGLIVIEQELGQCLGQLGFTDTGRAEEQEGTDRPVRILQTGTRPAHGVGYGGNRLILTDDTGFQLLFHLEQLLSLALHHPINRNTGPAADHGGDIGIRHLFLAHLAFFALGF